MFFPPSTPSPTHPSPQSQHLSTAKKDQLISNQQLFKVTNTILCIFPMSSSTIKMLRSLFTSYGGGCGCGRPNPKEVYDPKRKPRPCHSSSSSWERGAGNSIDDDLTSSTTHSFNNTDTSRNCSEHGEHTSCSKMVTPFPRFGDSVAIVKDSEDPYQDFRQSMLQMILEKEISSEDDLQELLNCFLQLNSSSHHRIIVQAFMDIWNGVVSKKPAEDQHHDQIVRTKDL